MFLKKHASKQLTKIWKVNVEKFTFSNVETCKLTTSLQTDLSYGIFREIDQIFSYLLQFLGTVTTELFCKTFFMSACEIGTEIHKQISIEK